MAELDWPRSCLLLVPLKRLTGCKVLDVGREGKVRRLLQRLVCQAGEKLLGSCVGLPAGVGGHEADQRLLHLALPTPLALHKVSSIEPLLGRRSAFAKVLVQWL